MYNGHKNRKSPSKQNMVEHKTDEKIYIKNVCLVTF